MSCAFDKITDLLNDIDNALKDESDAVSTHNPEHVNSIREQRIKSESILLDVTPTTLSDTARMIIAISEMIARSDHPDLGPAVNAIGQRILHETYPLVS